MDTNNKTNNKTHKIKNYVKKNGRVLIPTALIVGQLTMLTYIESLHLPEQGVWGTSYDVISTQGINQGELKEVKSFRDEYKDAEPWRAILHWYNPKVIRHVEFTDNSKATLEYNLWRNCSYIKRKVLGPEPGEKYALYGHELRYYRKQNR